MFKEMIAAFVLFCVASFANADLWEDFAKYKYGDEPNTAQLADEAVTKTPLDQRGPVEAKLIAIIKSEDATSDAKQWTCRLLQRIGTEKCVPALADILHDEVLSQYARLTLETMRDSEAAGAALRSALTDAPASVTPGLLGSIAARGDREAVGGVAKLIGNKDEKVAAAAIRALGLIGGREAGMTLRDFKAPDSLKHEKAEALIAVARSAASAGRNDVATSILTNVYASTEDNAQRVAAINELLIADVAKGHEMLVNAINNGPTPLREGALTLIAVNPNSALTATVANALDSYDASARALVVTSLGKRGDTKALGKIAALLSADEPALLAAAVAATGDLGGADQVPALLKVAAGPHAATAKPLDAIAVMADPEVDDAVMKSLADPSTRAHAIDALTRRGSATAGEKLVEMTRDSDASVRIAAWNGLRDLGNESDMPQLVKTYSLIMDGGERSAAGRAIKEICTRANDRDKAFAALASAYREGNDATKMLAVEIAPVVGSGGALAVAKEAVASDNVDLSRQALRSMSAWPNSDAAEPLLELAKSADGRSTKILALRGCLEVAGKGGNAKQQLNRLGNASKLIERPEEKRLLTSQLQNVKHIESTRMLRKYFDDKDIRRDAMLAAVEQIWNSRNDKANREEMIETLQLIADTASDKSLKDRANHRLGELKKMQ